MEQSKTEKSNTKEEMSVVKAEPTEIEKAMIARFLKRDERKALKVKKGPAGNQLAAQEKNQTLYSAKMMEAFGTPDTELQTYLLNQVINTFQGLLPSEWVLFKTYSAGNMHARTLRRRYS